ncbi:N-acetylmuramoyl-L-alanine amidase [Streptomyces sp. DSM 3412]|uniref:N-acetylmuramoyl-L-alanine amidase n=1 Tax=Streptomyces gottesmaniae TaxID=3075518 RepID=A0ABU2YWZ9_9ACTN|nr:N-acetylmuramoyl-L-alanine amidase [Streptomyces sp. DSM 3412]MDT0568854.1 N-acetylmuramoyl-L-alanine amidase [Streptomyces sp. DSM 3412]
MKLVTRAQWGARDYRTPNGATPYSRARRGVKLHYLGTEFADRTHDRCGAYIRLLQDQHMDGRGWSDIGYSFLVCTHGYVYEGRGLKRRNSANGNTTLNEQDYAVCLLVGSSGRTQPTDEQLHGARDAIEHCRTNGPAGDWLGGHRDGYATTCPGDAVYAWAKKGAPRPDDGGSEPETPATERPVVDLSKLIAAAKADPPKKGTPVSYPGTKVVEAALVAEGLLARSLADGHFGSATVDAYALWQRRCGWSGDDADGLPGIASLTKLGKRRGFDVKE